MSRFEQRLRMFNVYCNNFVRKNQAVLLLISIVCFYLVNNLIWLSQNTLSSGPDEPWHLLISLRLFKSILSGAGSFLRSFTQDSLHWPPLYHLSSAVLNLFLGDSYISSVMVNVPYLAVLVVSVYLIGLKFFDRRTAMLSVVFLSFYPMVFRYSRFFTPDFALTALVTLSICLLLYTQNFSSRRLSLLFGISLGLGMLIKWTFLLFLVGPLAWFSWGAFFPCQAQPGSRKERVFNLGLSLVMAVLISSLWYLPASSAVINRVRVFLWDTRHYRRSFNPELIYQPLLQPGKFLGYLRLLVNEQISFLFFVALIAALPFFILKCKNRLLLISWYAVPYLALSFSYSQEGRFMLASLPALALITAAGIGDGWEEKKNNFFKLDLCLIIILLGLLQFFDISYNYSRKEKNFPLKSPVGKLHLLYTPYTEHHSWSYGPPLKKDWKLDKVAGSIIRHYKYLPNKPSTVIIGTICEDDYAREIYSYPRIIEYYLVAENNKLNFSVIDLLYHRHTLNFIAELNEMNYVVFISGNRTWPKFDNLLKEKFSRILSDRTALLQKRILPVVFPLYNFSEEEAHKMLSDFLDNKKNNFKLIEKISLPEGYCAYLYKRII